MDIRRKTLIIISVVIILAVSGMIYIIDKKNYSIKISKSIPINQITEIGTYKVTQVFDGDTIAIDMMGSTERVRLIGVDTPETHDPDESLQCYGNEASGYSKENLLGKKVRLKSDPTNQNRDRYNRLLRYVYLVDGTLWNQKLVEEGYGFAYLRYPFTKLEDFKSIESISRAEKRGLWLSCSPTIINGVYKSNSVTSE